MTTANLVHNPERRTLVKSALGTIWNAMSPARRRNFHLVLAVLLLSAITELLTIGAVIPFLAIISGVSAPDGGLLGLAADVPSFVSSDNPILFAAILIIAAGLISAVARIILTWTMLRFVMLLSHEMGEEVFSRMLRQPYAYYVSRNSSELIGGMEKVQVVVWGVLMPAMQGVTSGFIAATIVILLFLLDPFTAIAAAATIVLTYILFSLGVRNRLKANSEKLAEAATGRVKIIQEGLGGMRDILLEQSQKPFEDSFRRLDLRYRKAQAVNNLIVLSPRFIVEAAGIVVIAFLALYYSSRDGGILAALPILGAMALGAQRLLPLLQQSYTGWSGFMGSVAMMEDVAELLEAPVVSTIPKEKDDATKSFSSEISLDRVSFRYLVGHVAVDEINLKIRKGSCVGIVGETGSGKSTLLDILMGLLEPTSGTIRVDGVAIEDSNRANWQAQIAHVPQSIFLSDNSIAANIAFGSDASEIDFERVERAARQSHIHEHIMTLPNGYGTAVGERGIRLSGGQRQRLGIARALYKDASVLILDEATSALDDATERAIIRSIEETGQQMTILMIAHRTSTLAGCDEVVRLHNGRIVERGDYRSMIRKE